MDGPWNKYQTQSGPWAKYAQANTVATDATQVGPAPSRGESLGRGLTDTTRGLTQLLANLGYQQGFEATPGSKASQQLYSQINAAQPGLADTANRVEAEQEADYQNRRGPDAGIDWTRIGGSLVGSAPLLATPAGATSLGGAAAQGALTGGLNAALQPVSNTAGSFTEQKTKQVATGAAVGGVFQPLMTLASRFISPKVADDVKYLQERGVKVTPGQAIGQKSALAEDKLTSVPVMGGGVINAQRRATESMNVAAYNEALAPIGVKASGKVGHEGVKEVGNKLSQAYDDLIPTLKLAPDDQFVSELQQSVASRLPTMSEEKAKLLQRIVEQRLPRGPLAGQGIKDVQSKIGQEIARYSRSSDPGDRAIAEVLEEMSTSIKDAVARSSPEVAERLAAIDSGWSLLTRIERAAASAGNSDGVFTGRQLLSAVRQGSDTVRKRGFARGTSPFRTFAKAAANVVGNRYPDSGTGGRLLAAGFAGGAVPAALVNPVATGGAVGALGLGRAAYSEPGANALVSLLTKRPASAPQFAGAVRGAGVPANLALANFLIGTPPGTNGN